MKHVRVEASGSYDVLIGAGLLKDSGKLIAECVDSRKAVVVTDDVVEGLFGGACIRSLTDAGFSASLYAFPAGERSKTMRTLTEILEYIGDRQLG